MHLPRNVADRRVVARSALLAAVVAASQRHGATALHVLGSLGHQTAVAMSDVDAWLTFPDDAIVDAAGNRFALYRGVGDLLLTHEAPRNRPLGGVYTLALYQTPSGPVQVDWYLAPQRTSRVAQQAAVLFEQVPVPRGEWRLDHDATAEPSLGSSVNWLTAMLFVAVKTLVRGDDAPFLGFLAEAYREVQGRYGLGRMAVTDPTSLDAVGQMLRQLAPAADETQRRAILAVEAHGRALHEHVLSAEVGGLPRTSW